MHEVQRRHGTEEAITLCRHAGDIISIDKLTQNVDIYCTIVIRRPCIRHTIVCRRTYKCTTLRRRNVVYLRHGGGNVVDIMTSLSSDEQSQLPTVVDFKANYRSGCLSKHNISIRIPRPSAISRSTSSNGRFGIPFA